MDKDSGRKLIEKQLLAADFVNGGLATPDRKNRFETHIRGTNDMMNVADIQFTKAGVMRVTTDQEYLGRRVLGVPTENVAFGGITEPDFGTKGVQLRKLTGGFDISYEALLENIESKDYVAGLTDRFMEKAAYDLSDWAVNADIATGAGIMALTDGYHTLSNDSYIFDAQGSEISRNIFHAGFRALPKEVRRRKSQLRWFANTLLQNNWVEVYGDRATAGGDTATKGMVISPDGIPFVTCDEMADNLSVGYTAATYGSHTGTVFDTFVITAANNTVSLDTQVAPAALLGPQVLTMTVGTYTAPELAAHLNVLSVAAGHPAVWHAVDGRLKVRTTLTGAGNSVVIAVAGISTFLATVGMTANTYAGAAANAAGAINQGTYMWLTLPANFRMYISEEFRTYWEYVPRRDSYMFTTHIIAAPYLVEPSACVRVDNIRLKDYR